MSTLPLPATQHLSPPKGLGGRQMLGAALLWLLGTLLVLLSALPVALLFVATAVPLYWALLLALADVGLVIALFRLERTPLVVLGILVAIVLISTLGIWLSQRYATTPPFTNAQGEPVAGSIASLEQVTLNGSEQWILIRGRDASKPVLLFLAGGPGGSQLTTARHELAALEDHFVVVNWEQPGAGKSFNAVDRSTLTPWRYVNDGLALTRYLGQRFGQEKIYLLGESWGSALGVLMVQQRPELFHAFTGTAQMVAFLETDLICYDFAVQWAQEQGNTRRANALRDQGPPPYFGAGVAWKQVNYLKDTYAYMNQNPAILTDFNTLRDLGSPEYGLLDIVNWVRGPLDTLGVVYQQVWEVDLREQAPQLEVPVYFFTGRHDINAPPALVEEYIAVLDAPHKEIVWFERSGHSPWVSESDRFVDEMVNRVLYGQGAE